MKFRTKLGLGVGGLACLLGAAALAPAFMDADWMRTRLVDAVRRQTGRTLRIDSLHVWLLPYPWISARGVGLSNMPGADSQEMFSAAELRARLSLTPLLHHRVVLENVSLSRPRLTLERLPDGRANWIWTPPARTGTEPETGGGAAEGAGQHWNLALGSLSLRNGFLQWNDARHDVTGAVDLDRVDVRGLDSTMTKLSLSGHRGEGGFEISGGTGPLPFAVGQPWPLNLTASLSVAGHRAGTVQIGGVVADPVNDSGYDLQINGTLDHLRDLETLFPHAGLPEISGLSAQAGVTGSGREPSLRMLHLKAGDAALDRLFPGLRATAVSLDSDSAEDRVAVSLDGQMTGQPVSVRGQFGTLDQTARAVRAPDAAPLPVRLSLVNGSSSTTLDGVVGGRRTSVNVQGELPSLTFGPGRPTLQGIRVSGHLASSAPLGELKKGDTGSLLRLSQATLDIAAAHMNWQSVAWENVTAHMTLDGGRLELDPIRGMGAGSTAQGTAQGMALGMAQSGRVTYDASGVVPRLRVTAAPFVLPTQAIQSWSGMPDLVNGSMQIVGSLVADGDSLDAWEKTVTGHVGLSMVGGRVNGRALEKVIGRNVPVRGTLALRCFGSHMQLADGRATIERLGLEADILSLTGHGTVTLANGALDMHLLPHIGVGGAAASSSVAVGGTVDAPQPRLEPGSDGRFAISIGGPAGVVDQCPDLLAAAREGTPGPAAAPASVDKMGGVMNMLKGLLR